MNKKLFMNNKRGIAPLIIGLIIFAGLGLLLGIGGMFKVSQITHSIPTWFWYVLIGVTIYIIIKQ